MIQVICSHCRTEITFLDQQAADAHAGRHAKRLSAAIDARRALRNA